MRHQEISSHQQKDANSMPTYSHGTTMPEIVSSACASTHLDCVMKTVLNQGSLEAMKHEGLARRM